MQIQDFQHIVIEIDGNGVALAILNRPESLNATNARMHWEMTQLWQTLDAHPDVKAIVVTGAGERAFSAGGDLAWIETLVGNPVKTRAAMQEARDLVYNMLACSKPIVSAINGTAVGAGLAVALMADVSVIAEEAKITDGHVKLGVAAGDHAPIIWPLLCGMAKAKYYLMTGEFMNGREAERLGLVTFCLPRTEVLDKAMTIATNLSKGSQTAISDTKMALNNWMQLAGPIFDNALTLEMMGFLGPDAKEGLAAFNEKRAPVFPSAQHTTE